MEIAAKMIAIPPSIQATGKPANKSKMKETNIKMARTSLISIVRSP